MRRRYKKDIFEVIEDILIILILAGLAYKIWF